MSGRTRTWMRLARLLIACVAFFVARPAEAATAVDRIVLVAELATSHEIARPARAPASPSTRKAPARAPQLDRAASLQPASDLGRDLAPGTPLVLVPEKYLRNCSLLR
jgi:hypothetical protein